MGLRNLFRPRRPVDTDALDAIREAVETKERTREQTLELREKNDRMEAAVIENHFGEKVAVAWQHRLPQQYREAHS